MQYVIGAAGGVAATLGGVIVAGIYAFRHPQFVFKKMMKIMKAPPKPQKQQHLPEETHPHG